MTPDSRAKPFGVTSLLPWAASASPRPPTPRRANSALVTKQPYFQAFQVGDVGKTAYYYGRWCTRTGLVGPMSAVASMLIA